MHIEITLRSGRTERIEVAEGDSLDDTLTALLNHSEMFATAWVPVKKGSEFVRYDEIVSVRPVP